MPRSGSPETCRRDRAAASSAARRGFSRGSWPWSRPSSAFCGSREECRRAGPDAGPPRRTAQGAGGERREIDRRELRVTRRVMKVISPEFSVADTASGSSRSAKRARSSLFLRSRSQSAMNEAKSTWRSFASTGAASRKCTSMNSPSFSAIRCWLLWMIAVCGIGRPSGRRNSATTAYQSASPPMVAASAKAAIKPNAACTGSSILAPMKVANVAASTSVASSFTRRSSAARAASPGTSKENVAGAFMTAFGADILSRTPSS